MSFYEEDFYSLFDSRGFLAKEKDYEWFDKSLMSVGKGYIVYFMKYDNEIVYIGSGQPDRPKDHLQGHSNVRFFNRMKQKDREQFLSYDIVKTFNSQDMSLFYESFCIRKFKPPFNKLMTCPDDMVDVFQKRFSHQEGFTEIGFDDKRYKAHLLNCCGYSQKIICKVLDYSENTLSRVLKREYENEGIVCPFEYVGLDRNIKVDHDLFKYFKKENEDIIKCADSYDSILFW